VYLKLGAVWFKAFTLFKFYKEKRVC